MITPKEYYYKHFRKDFESFWAKVPRGKELFKFAELIKRSSFDALENVPRDNLIYFLSALGCTILIDQVMFTYFKSDYPEFQEMTLYPKMEVGWMNANPWMVFHQNVRLPRGLHKREVVKGFSEFVNFFVDDLKNFFENNNFKEATWGKVAEAMKKDPDVAGGEFGIIFLEKFEEIEKYIK